MVKYMKLFNDIRNFIDNNSFKIIIYENIIDIINYEKIIDISNDSIKVMTNKIIDITGKNLCIIKLLDNEILIKGNIINIRYE